MLYACLGMCVCLCTPCALTCGGQRTACRIGFLLLPSGFWGLVVSHWPCRSSILQLTVLSSLCPPWNGDVACEPTCLSENVSLFYPWATGEWSMTYFIARKTLMKTKPSVKLISKIYASMGD